MLYGGLDRQCRVRALVLQVVDTVLISNFCIISTFLYGLLSTKSGVNQEHSEMWAQLFTNNNDKVR